MEEKKGNNFEPIGSDDKIYKKIIKNKSMFKKLNILLLN